MISRRIESAQKAVETQNFESRKHVLEYDDVMNKQREAVYGLRRQLMEGVDQKQLITEDYLSTLLSNLMDQYVPEKAHPEQWKTEELFGSVKEQFGANLDGQIDAGGLNRHDLGEALFEKLQQRFAVKEQILGTDQMRYHERIVMLSVLDGLWKDHLLSMDHLKEGIGLRGYAQQDPLVAYKKESFEIFEAMMLRFQEDTVRHLFNLQIIGPDGTPIESAEQLMASQMPDLLHAPVVDPAAPGERNGRPVLAEPTMPVRPTGAPASAGELPRLEQRPEPQPGQRSAPRISKAPTTTIDALEREFEARKKRELAQAREAGGATNGTSNGNGSGPQLVGPTVGRNDPCPCGSGRKYKRCHGAEV